MMPRICSALLASLAICQSAFAGAGVVFLPFDDRVKLKEAWNLGVDVPRWYSQTVDTISANDSLVKSVNFDTVQALLKENRWNRADYTAPTVIQRIAAKYNADFVVTGRVTMFKVVKRAINSDAAVNTSQNLAKGVSGQGGTPIMAGLQTYSSQIKMTVDIYSAATGAIVKALNFDSERKDGGLKIWLPVQMDNDELNFHYLSRSPFGSVYFHRSVVGAHMRNFSLSLHNALAELLPETSEPARRVSQEFVEGKVLERAGQDVYLNLGNADNVFLGEVLEVLKPQRPVLGDKGDTLGWVEQPIAEVKVRSIKSPHFCQALVVRESDSIRSGMSVRVKVGGTGTLPAAEPGAADFDRR